MAVDMFLKIDGIKGDSTDSKHKDWIEVISFDHGIYQATGGSASAQGVHTGGRADHKDFTLIKRLDSASPILAQHVCTGKHIPNIKFELCRALGDKTTFMVYTLKESIVASVAPTGTARSEDLLPTEQITVRYGEINWEYTPTDPKGGGKTGAAIKAGWSTMENRSI
jgi:type VI secretion system secreted protein Hcp